LGYFYTEGKKMKNLSKAVLYGAVCACLAASGIARADSFSYSGSVVTYKITTTGVYDITAAGAQGGNSLSGGSGVGGLGASIGGDVALTAGTQLDIVVGGQGNISGNYGGGGGGGSFVYEIGALQPLIVAGGGGGSGWFNNHGGSGQTTTSGDNGNGPGDGTQGVGGANGSGGGAGTINDFNGGGGAGWSSNGGGTASSFNGGGGFGPTTFAGGAGGPAASPPPDGGFGGGGGGGNEGGGGGGGYSGGGGGSGNGNYGGGGGGSYYDPSFTNLSLTAAANSGNGVVTIDLIAATVPLPTPLAGSLVGFAALFAWTSWRKRRQPVLE
jgi:hypothetical protein